MQVHKHSTFFFSFAPVYFERKFLSTVTKKKKETFSVINILSTFYVTNQINRQHFYFLLHETKRKKNENLTLISIKSMICVTISFRDLFSRVAFRFSFTKLLFFYNHLNFMNGRKDSYASIHIFDTLHSSISFIFLPKDFESLKLNKTSEFSEQAIFRGKSNFYDFQNKLIWNSVFVH